MPIPFALLGTAALKGASFGGSLLAAETASSVMAPASRAIGYTLNRATSNLMPAITDVINLWSNNWLTDPSIRSELLALGVDFDPLNPNNPFKRLWNTVAKNQLWQPDVNTLQDWFITGKIDREEFNRRLKRIGFRFEFSEHARFADLIASKVIPPPLDLIVANLRINGFLLPSEKEWIKLHGLKEDAVLDYIAKGIWQIPPDVALQQKTLGYMSNEDYWAQMSLAGFKRTEGRAIFEAMGQPLSPVETMLAFFRGKYTNTEMYTRLQANGLRNAKEVEAFQEISRPIPGPSDLVSFALKEVWDSDVVARFGYDAEFPQAVEYWLRKQGFKDTEEAFSIGGVNYPALSWARAYWRAHWQVISPGQAYEMLHRFRGNPDDSATWRVPGVKPFLQADVDTVLKVADYPQPFRERLSAMSYHLLTRVDVRRMIETRSIGRDDAVERYQDMGYKPADAALLADFVTRNADKKRLDKQWTSVLARLKKGYYLGVINATEFAKSIYAANPASTLSAAAFTALPAEVQAVIASGDSFTQVMVSEANAQIATSLVTDSIKSVRSAYLRWFIDDTLCLNSLISIGVELARANQFIMQWRIQRIMRGKDIAAAKVLDFVKRGIMNAGDATFRLLNMGYSNLDVSRMLAALQQDIQLSNAQAAEKMAKTNEQRLKAAEQVVVKMQAAADKQRARLLKLGTPAKLISWLAKGIINETKFRVRMGDMGILPIDIDAAVEEAKLATKKEQATAGKTKAAANGQAT